MKHLQLWLLLLVSGLCIFGKAPCSAAAVIQFAPGDTFTVTVGGHPEMGGTVTVGTDGIVYLPIVNAQKVDGLTPDELITKLTAAYKTRLRSPEIFVTLGEQHTPQILIVGSVKNSGKYPLLPKSQLIELILQAGGLSLDAENGTGKLIQHSTGKAITFPLNETLAGTATLPLADGDIISIEPLPTITVYVTGEVMAPGRYELHTGASVSTALAAAQGLRGKANSLQITILRGLQETIIDPVDVYNPKSTADLPLEAADILKVETALESVQVTGEVVHPGAIQVPRGVGIKELLNLAGGTTASAQLSTISITHRDGSTNIVDCLTDSMPEVIHDGDQVFVPSTLSNIKIDGEVAHPGTYQVSKQMTLMDMLQLAGGHTNLAALGEIKVQHSDGVYASAGPDFSAQTFSTLGLHNGDRLIVPATNTYVIVRGNVNAPGNYPIDKSQPYTVNEALFRAKGINVHGNAKKVTIIRAVGGTTRQMCVNVSAMNASPDKTGNFLLQPGDTVVVPPSHALPGWKSVVTSISTVAILGSLLD